MAGLALSIQSSANVVTPFGTLAVGPFTFTGTVQPQTFVSNLQSGNNTFTVPTSLAWVGVIIIPPTTNTIVLKYKTTSGDTGIIIPPSAPSVILFDSTTPSLPTTLYINAASNTTGNTSIMFF